MKSIIAVILASTLAACGGGGGGGGSAPVQAPVLKDCPVTRIQLFGDSTQYGHDPVLNEHTAINPTTMLQRAMDIKFGYGKVFVEGRAMPGTTSTQLLNGLDGLNKPWPMSVNAEIVVINHGINDKLKDTGIEQYKYNLRTMAKAPAIVVFETPLPIFHWVTGYDDAMRSVAMEMNIPVIDSNKYALSFADWYQYAPDYVHPTETGTTLIVNNAKMPVLAPIVAKMRAGCN